MRKLFTCILCPNGCEIQADVTGENVSQMKGYRCEKGAAYVRAEVKNPVRSIASSVLVEEGELPLVSVRLTKPVPKERIFAVMKEIKKQQLTAPVKAGQVIIKDVLGLNSDVIATKQVGRISSKMQGNDIDK